jgi:hypothetical protein
MRYERVKFVDKGMTVWTPFAPFCCEELRPMFGDPERMVRCTVQTAAGYDARIVNPEVGIDRWMRIDDLWVAVVDEERDAEAKLTADLLPVVRRELGHGTKVIVCCRQRRVAERVVESLAVSDYLAILGDGCTSAEERAAAMDRIEGHRTGAALVCTVDFVQAMQNDPSLQRAFVKAVIFSGDVL